jgi:DNA-binding CsgD family transcriptional regulator/PAS domain-containing protein
MDNNPPMTHDEFERLIEAIYTAALDRAQWAQVLPRIGDALGGAGVLIGVHQAVGRMAWEQTARLDPDCTARFKAQYTQTSVVVQPMPQMIVGEPFPMEAILPARALKKTDFYQDTLKPQGLLHGLNMLLVRQPTGAAVLGLVRAPRQGLYTQEELALLRRLAPHLSRALQIDLRLASTQAQRDSLAALLDHLTTATVLLDATGEILYANAAAETLLARGDGLQGRGGRLLAVHRGSQVALSQAIAAAQSCYRDLAIAPSPVVLHRPAGGRPYTALVVPCPPAAVDRAGLDPRAAVMLLLVDPDTAPRQSPTAILQALYGLTPKEARLAAVLATGPTLAAAAATLHVSLNTVKTQCQAIFAKTDTRRQADLVRLLRGLGSDLAPRSYCPSPS